MNYCFSGVVACLLLFFLTSCEHAVSVESIVNTDGSIERTVILLKADSSAAIKNMFGIGATQGWEVAMEEDSESSQEKHNIMFRKHFASVDEANAQMDGASDTLFSMRSDFEKQFRWFYTYMKYSDTYRAINRFAKPDVSDYFTPEDFAFIDRLPAEGAPISHADSIYLSRLNEKIYDVFAARGFYDVYYDAMIEAGRKNQMEQRWIDTLKQKKEEFFLYLLDHDNDFDEDFMMTFIDSLQIPTSPQMNDDYEILTAPIDSRVEFMTVAGEGEYLHHIRMPWKVIKTNADSLDGDDLYWQPPVARFLLKDYTMYAESRTMNYWAVIVSAIIVGFTLFVLFRKRSG